MFRKLGSSKPTVAARRCRAKIGRRPSHELLEVRSLLSVVGQTSFVNAYTNAADYTMSGYYYNNISQPPSPIAPISASTNLSSTNPTIPATATASASLNSSFSNDDASSGNVKIDGNFTTNGMTSIYNEATAYYFINYTVTIKNSANSAQVLTIPYDIKNTATNFNNTRAVLLYDNNINAVSSGSGALTYNLSSGATDTITIKIACEPEPFLTNDTASSMTSCDVSWSLAPPQISTETLLSSSSNPSTYGVPVTFAATVLGGTPDQPTPTGTVTFYDGSMPLGPATQLVSGVAKLTTSDLNIGTDTITALYSGDANYADSTSNTIDQNVEDNIPHIAITNSPTNGIFYINQNTSMPTIGASLVGVTPDPGTMLVWTVEVDYAAANYPALPKIRGTGRDMSVTYPSQTTTGTQYTPSFKR